MTVGELKSKLQYYNDDTDIVLSSDCIHGTAINQDFSIQTNDGDDNSPVYIEFSLGDMVAPATLTEEINSYIKQSILDCWDKSEIVGVAVLACKLLNIPNDDGNGFAEFEEIFAKELTEWEQKNCK